MEEKKIDKNNIDETIFNYDENDLQNNFIDYGYPQSSRDIADIQEL